MNPMEAVSSVFRNYVNFNGRARRSEFWWFVLFAFISQTILNLIPFVGQIYTLVLLLPSLAVTVRRLHDTNRTAWWMLLYLVPIVGFVVLAIIFVAVLGFYALDPWGTSDVEWGILGILFLIWLLGSIAVWIMLLIFQIMPGTMGPNRYGPDPLQPAQGVGGFGYTQPGNPYSQPPLAGGYAQAGEPITQEQSDLDLDQGLDPDSSQRRYCTQCGMQQQLDARFCTQCGTAI